MPSRRCLLVSSGRRSTSQIQTSNSNSFFERWRARPLGAERRAQRAQSTRPEVFPHAHASGCLGRLGAAAADGSCSANASVDAGGGTTSADYSSTSTACCRTLCTDAAGFCNRPTARDDALLEGTHASRASPRRASRRQPGSRKASGRRRQHWSPAACCCHSLASGGRLCSALPPGGAYDREWAADQHQPQYRELVVPGVHLACCTLQ